MANSSNGSSIIASLILGASVLGAAFMLGSAIDSASINITDAISDLEGSFAAAPQRAAAPPSPRGSRPDPSRYYEVNTKGSPARGPEKARIDIVEFSDFQCPFCARVNPTVQRIRDEYGDDVRIVFKHLPLRIHPQAPAAHAAAEAAHSQGKFWEMHDLIFANQRALTRENYLGYAKQIGLDVARFTKDLDSSDIKKRVDDDASEAASLGVTGTPAFFINGRFLSGAQPFDSFKRVIDAELAKG